MNAQITKISSNIHLETFCCLSLGNFCVFIQLLLILFSLCCVQKDSESSLEYYAVRTILPLGTEEPSNQQKQRSTQNPFENTPSNIPRLRVREEMILMIISVCCQVPKSHSRIASRDRPMITKRDARSSRIRHTHGAPHRT